MGEMVMDIYTTDYSKLDQWFKAKLDWAFLNSIVMKTIDAVCTTFYYDKFFELHPSELGVEDWVVIKALFTEVETLIVNKEEETGFYYCELGIIGKVKIGFIGYSGLIYMDEIEFSSLYELTIRDQDFIVYQAEFYPEEVGFIIDYDFLNSIRE